ncbi:hypothetical protein TNCV_2239831 [Trichonephila clavipes]|nr:hypothetical protein TNCV_2239831 [Trichonephila clavipes]
MSQTLDHLEDNIRRVIADIRPQMLEKAIENWTSRLDYIRASRGSRMPEIGFKIPWLEIQEVLNGSAEELNDLESLPSLKSEASGRFLTRLFRLVLCQTMCVQVHFALYPFRAIYPFWISGA